jgi:hypothetical protein
LFAIAALIPGTITPDTTFENNCSMVCMFAVGLAKLKVVKNRKAKALLAIKTA